MRCLRKTAKSRYLAAITVTITLTVRNLKFGSFYRCVALKKVAQRVFYQTILQQGFKQLTRDTPIFEKNKWYKKLTVVIVVVYIRTLNLMEIFKCSQLFQHEASKCS